MTIALLATGDEIVHGDTLNTNGHNIAHALSSEGLSIGLHMSCSDKEADILQSLNFLKQDHDVIIMTGGLGPTSDDRTRFALAKSINQPLIEYSEALEHVKQRLKSTIALDNGNQQQALFPEDTALLPNPYGSALGGYGLWQNKLFILLPGPPRECLPMFDNFILPLLRQRQHSEKIILKWLIFGLAESEIAHTLDNALKDLPCQTGYRLDIPYIEFKVRCKAALTETVNQRVAPLLQKHIISTPDKKASTALREKIIARQQPLVIVDEVTGGLLQSLLQVPENYAFLYFYPAPDLGISFHLKGLEAYWQQLNKTKAQVIIQYQEQGREKTESWDLPYRSNLVLYYAAEWLSFRLFHLIDKLHD